jgi:hypothetical protein
VTFPTKSLFDIRRFDRSAFSIPVGLRAGAFVASPLLLGLLTGHKELVYTTLGALFLTNTTQPRSELSPWKVLLVACITESSAFGLGTLSGTTGLLAVPLMGIGVFLALSFGSTPGWSQVALFTSMFYAVGVGLPGGTVVDASQRFVFALVGALWGWTGVELHRVFSTRMSSSGKGGSKRFPPPISFADTLPTRPQALRFIHSDAFGHAMIVGIASAAGLTIGLALGLPRDFWIVVTIVLSLRPTMPGTLSFTSMIVIGTLIGAVIAASITFTISDDYILWVLLLLVCVCLYSTRGMNFGLTQVFFTPFLIILLNILYRGEWMLAEIRILDVAIGGAVAVATASLFYLRHSRKKKTV